jgi:hypothetical protein
MLVSRQARKIWELSGRRPCLKWRWVKVERLNDADGEIGLKFKRSQRMQLERTERSSNFQGLDSGECVVIGVEIIFKNFT